MTANQKALVLVTTSFPIVGDGSEAAGGFVADLAETLSEHVPIRVVAPGAHNAREAWRKGIEVFRFAAPDRPLSTLKPWRLSDLSVIRRVLAAGESATHAAVQAGPTAHLLALWALPSGHWARRVSRRYGVPYSVWTLGSDIWSLGRIPFIRGYIARVLKNAALCYSDGLKLADDTRRIGGREVLFLPSTRRVSGLRSAPFRQSGPFRLLFLGRWHANKGVDLLMSALALLSERAWAEIESVDICGGGPLESQVREAVSGLLSQRRPVRLRGYLDKAEAVEAFLAADYLLLPSRIESIPVVFSDSIKMGCPIICTPVGDLPALIGGAAVGTIAEAVTAEGIAAAIELAVSAEGRGRIVVDDLRTMALRFDLDGVCQRLSRELVPTTSVHVT